MRENRAYHRLKKRWPAAHWQRFESWTGAGIFDVNGCNFGREIWVECKQGTVKKNGIISCKVRSAQVAWEFARRKAGGNTYIALLLGKELLILPGANISILNGMPHDFAKEMAHNIADIWHWQMTK